MLPASGDVHPASPPPVTERRPFRDNPRLVLLGIALLIAALVAMVTLADRWLADVGFGDSFLEPLLLDERGEQDQGTHSFRILEDDEHLILMRDSQPQYRFTLQPYNFVDYEEMCRFHQTSPESHFTKNLICSRVTGDGRITLSGMNLITTSGAERNEKTVNDQEEYDRILRDQFGIVK